jgi:hypothetical protein
VLIVTQDFVGTAAIKIGQMVNPLQNRFKFVFRGASVASAFKPFKPLFESVDNGLSEGLPCTMADLSYQTLGFGVLKVDRHGLNIYLYLYYIQNQEWIISGNIEKKHTLN